MMIPIESMTHHIAVLGKTGSGKTYTAKSELVERILDLGLQVAIVDPTSAWWGLRLDPSGKKPSGFDVMILGGPHGDLPLTDNMGEACARILTEQLVSVVFDTSLMTVGERTRWFTAFAIELYRTIKQPMTLVLDEVHNFCPQGKVPDPATGKMLHAANQLFSGGRSRGIRLVGISQRPAKWHKDALTSVDTLVVHRMLAPQDRGAVKDWIDGAGDAKKGREVLDSLAGLQRGEAWVWFPEGDVLRRGRAPRIRTFDSSATPDHGAPTAALHAIDLAQVRTALAEAVRQAEANDPKRLRARIDELEAELAAALAGGESDPDANGSTAMQAEIDRLEADNRDLAAELQKAEAGFRELVERGDRIRKFVMDMTIEIPPHPRGAAAIDRSGVTVGPRSPDTAAAGITAPPSRDPPASPTAAPGAKGGLPAAMGNAENLTNTHMRVLAAAARLWNYRIEATPLRGAVLAGYAADSGNFNNLLGRLSAAGVIKRNAGKIVPGDRWRAVAASLPRSEPLNQLVICSAMLALVKGRHLQILHMVCSKPKHEWAAEEIAARMGLAAGSGNFNNLLGYLSGRRLIVRERGTVRVNPELVLF